MENIFNLPAQQALISRIGITLGKIGKEHCAIHARLESRKQRCRPPLSGEKRLLGVLVVIAIGHEICDAQGQRRRASSSVVFFLEYFVAICGTFSHPILGLLQSPAHSADAKPASCVVFVERFRDLSNKFIPAPCNVSKRKCAISQCKIAFAEFSREVFLNLRPQQGSSALIRARTWAVGCEKLDAVPLHTEQRIQIVQRRRPDSTVARSHEHVLAEVVCRACQVGEAVIIQAGVQVEMLREVAAEFRFRFGVLHETDHLIEFREDCRGFVAADLDAPADFSRRRTERAFRQLVFCTHDDVVDVAFIHPEHPRLFRNVHGIQSGAIIVEPCQRRITVNQSMTRRSRIRRITFHHVAGNTRRDDVAGLRGVNPVCLHAILALCLPVFDEKCFGGDALFRVLIKG